MYRSFSSPSANKKQPQPGAGALREFVQVWQYTGEDYTIGLEWTADAKRIVAVPESGPIIVLDAATGEVLHELKGHRGGNNAAAWHPAGQMLATGGQDGIIRLWTFGTNAGTAPQLLELEGGEQMVEHLAWSRPENSNPLYPRLASAAGRTLRLWDSTGKLVREHARYPKAISGLKWLGSKQMVSTASFGGVAVWGTSDGQLKRTLEYKNPLISLSWSPDLRWAAAGTQDQGIHIWRTTHQPDEMQMSGFATKVREMSWHKGSRWFATGGAPEVAVWDCGGPGPAGREPRQLVW
ncbi:MAG: WD40 repeat domain-containing protein, partial [Candidatus Methylacidiphilales bacterium]